MDNTLLYREDLNEVLGNLSKHLDSIAGQIFLIEEVIGNLLIKKSDIDAAIITRLQSLDYIRQSLEDTAMLSHLLRKDDLSGQLEIDEIISKLKLEDTIKLLGVRTNSGGDCFHRGEIDLFR